MATRDEAIRYFYPKALPGVEVVLGRQVPKLLRLFHTSFGVATPLCGGSERLYRGTTHTSEPDTAMVTVPGETHVMLRVAPDTRYVAVRFAPERVFRHAEELGLAARSVAFSAARVDDPGLTVALRSLCAAVAAGAPALVQQERESDLLTALLSRHAEQAPPLLCTALLPIDRVRDCLLSDLGVTTTLDHLSAVAGISKSQLGRLFKRTVGLGPHAFLLAARVARSRDLLRAGASPADVAATLGFADQSHFSRIFKRQLGITPARFAQL